MSACTVWANKNCTFFNVDAIIQDKEEQVSPKYSGHLRE